MADTSSPITMPKDFYSNLFANELKTTQVKLSNFKKAFETVIETEGQSKREKIDMGGYDFLLQDITITGYCQLGNFFNLNGMARDLITVQLKNSTTGENYFEEGIDISLFNPLIAHNLVPQIIPANQNLFFEFKHERRVSPNSHDFPMGAAALSTAWNINNTGLTNPNSFPVYLKVAVSGAKIFKLGV